MSVDYCPISLRYTQADGRIERVGDHLLAELVPLVEKRERRCVARCISRSERLCKDIVGRNELFRELLALLPSEPRASNDEIPVARNAV